MSTAVGVWVGSFFGQTNGSNVTPFYMRACTRASATDLYTSTANFPFGVTTAGITIGRSPTPAMSTASAFKISAGRVSPKMGAWLPLAPRIGVGVFELCFTGEVRRLSYGSVPKWPGVQLAIAGSSSLVFGVLRFFVRLREVSFM